ncbi:MAG: bifunctional proline dehydrogenase/L-glutamate gamma-semialdehyde dehydrogenase PutA [Porticoccus sp.]|nr:bifunctional proline dehydrogenase/L-glutamate gamma-semialdehyde dehydrogenase PutA [Porticoccus sp.]
MSLARIRLQVRNATYQDEHFCVDQLVADSSISPNTQQDALALARQLVHQCRQQHHNKGSLDAFLQEFGLSNNEGIALMCLAEALLRVPDDATADKLIAEKIQEGDWVSHRGHSDSLFVNASIWGLMLTDQILPLESVITDDPQGWLNKLIHRLGDSVVRKAVLQAMRILGNQYVMGSTIESVINDKLTFDKTLPNKCFSFDMLGEGARTEADAQRYFDAYANAIECIGQNNNTSDVFSANGISIKLSALYPRYEYAQQSGVMSILLSRIRELAIAAKHHNIGLSIDAEEARRLDLSLDIFEALARDPALSQWQGLGFVLQAYQKRAPWVARWLIKLAEKTHRCLMVRLVKGAYWDAEIKYAQEQGMEDYPVFTRKVNTDLCYQHCAQILLSSPQAIYPQFATHNAHTLATILAISGEAKFEFQRLHGMGELLYQTLYQQLSLQQKKCSEKNENFSIPPVRIYAPIGKHRELLPYLVRRLLENGANNSFINQFLDEHVPIDTLVQEIKPLVLSVTPHRHQHIPKPPNLYIHTGEQRQNSLGVDLNNPLSVESLLESITPALEQHYEGYSIVRGHRCGSHHSLGADYFSSERQQTTKHMAAILSPSNRSHVVGHCTHASANDIEQAFIAAGVAQPEWDALGGKKRAELLNKMAEALEQQKPTLVALITSEAGRTIRDAISEIREAIDFCRYYAEQAHQHFSSPIELPGPTGEQNLLSLHGRGVFLCISPWNFPLAIFTGQIAAALAAGNTVVAKPAESTSLIATFATQLFLQAGVPVDALQLIVGNGGSSGKLALTNSQVSGVAFTGSIKTAKLIQQQLASKDGPIVPLIAETGGQNIMIADSTALPEQLVDDVIQSAFFSAGQRCSALRVLYLQEEIANDVLTMLSGALSCYRVGNPAKLSTDIGPVIDEKAQQTLLGHIKKMTKDAHLVAKITLTDEHQSGYFVAPHIFEIDSLGQLSEEIFGPVLHVIRYSANELDNVLEQINDSGYGLTLGVHSRIQAFSDYIFKHTLVGNTYINRNMIGAVVGTNPFGGCGLSGTGPKAGGPHYLYRFATEKTRTENLTARGGNTTLFRLTED